jgi:hypothetical protein
VLILLLALLSCTGPRADKSTNSNSANVKDSTENEYLKIINGLKYEYVLHYRQLKEANTDLIVFGLSTNDSIYSIDSMRYFRSSETFFEQDWHFVNWLLRFKEDSTKAGLWQKYLSPLSSYIGECSLPMSNSRAAINLLENFLNGEGFECYECKYKDVECSVDKYEQIESFLRSHSETNISSLRKEWKKGHIY